jgi:hypothetical protein
MGTTNSSIAAVSREALGAAHHGARRIVDSSHVAASGVLDLQRTALVMGIDRSFDLAKASNGRVHAALAGAVEEIDATARSSVGDVAKTMHATVGGVAAVIDHQLVTRVDRMFNGETLRSIERIALPVAETIRAASVGVSGLSDQIFEVAQPTMPQAQPAPVRKSRAKRGSRRA